ncbi:cytochrome P450 [Nocardia pseudovaccinii]|uniref:cytochrome P450 n=1 Tax=Nocardia pseudovaccinii TaxID=189540 RepID=UPI0007C6C6FB|nr:cytochrome P450 [Nocardia pseudovaccinii]
MSAGESIRVERPDHVASERMVEFDMYNPPDVEKGFHESWLTLQRTGGPEVVWTPFNGGHWIATRAELVQQVFSDYKRFSSRVILVPKAVGELMDTIPVQVDPPRHRPYRKLLNENLAPAVVRDLEGKIRETAIELIESFIEQGSCEFTKEFAEIYPIRIFLALVDLPAQDFGKLKSWVDAVIHVGEGMDQMAAFAALQEYISPYVDQRTGRDGTDLISRMINQTVEGRQITHDEAIALGVQVLIAGVDTVLNFVSFAMLFMANNPDYRRQLLEEPEIIHGAVDELLRRFAIVTMAREVREDIEFGGALLKKGEMIIAPSMLAGLDETVNACPMDVDFKRTGAVHATFGFGQHHCPGSHLARKEVQVMLEEWLTRIPEFSVAPGADITFRSGQGGSVNALPLTWPVGQEA